jgi:hypothetical protein
MPLGTIVSNAVNFRAWDINGNQTLWSPMHMLLDEAAVQITKTNTLPVGGGYPVITTATIANTQSLSGVVDLGRTILSGIVMPSGWTAASLTFAGSADNTTFVPVNYNGAELTLAVAASQGYSLDTSTFMPWRYLQIRSGTAGVPVNQGAARTLTLIGIQ